MLGGGGGCMVQDPSHVKQLSPINVCKIGLKGLSYEMDLAFDYMFGF